METVLTFRKWFVLAVFFGAVLSCSLSEAQTISANWIWQSATGPANTWMCFRKTITLTSAPASAFARIAADSKYWLWINGRLVVFEGELKRALPNSTYYDSVDLASYLTAGTTTIAAQVWYWGKEGFSHHGSGQGGFLFDAWFGTTPVRSDTSWRAKVYAAYQDSTTGGQPNNRLPEWNVVFDARKDSLSGWQQPDYSDAGWPAAVAKGVPPAAPWNALVKRPIPQWQTTGQMNYTNSASLPAASTGGVINATLPYDARVSACLSITAPSAGMVVNMQTDMYDSFYRFGGGPSVRAEYVTRAGAQSFESLVWMSGNTMKYTMPAGITIQGLYFREMGYPAQFSGQFSCSDNFYTTLWKKAQRTLYLCMFDDFMDCPDRERGLWWGDVVNESGECFYVLDTNSHALIRKAINVLMAWQRTDSTLFAPPSTAWTSELPVQMLATIGWYGFWNYFWNTGDSATIRSVYPGVRKYLGKWQLGSNGLVVHRNGGWSWSDWGSNIDTVTLDNEWYYLALKAAIPMAVISGYAGDTAGYRQRMNSISSKFAASFWNATGRYFRSSSVTTPDDRANAMAVISGLAPSQYYPGIRTVLQQNTFASPWMEKFVLEALCMMKSDSLALARMKSRYATQVSANYSTLWEVWAGLSQGTINHGWNAPNTVLSQYIGGIAATAAGWSSYQVLPQMGNLTSVNEVVPSLKGGITVSDSLSATRFTMGLTSPAGTQALVGIPKKRPWQSVMANGMPVWNNGMFLSGVSGVSGAGEDSAYIKFNVNPGTWNFSALLTPVSTLAAARASAGRLQCRQFAKGIQVSSGSGSRFSVQLFDCSGKCLLTLPNVTGAAWIPVSGSGRSVYIVRVAAGAETVVRKFIVSR